MKTYRVVAIPGDGIGPEILDAALEVLAAVEQRGQFRLDVQRVEAGAGYYRKTGQIISEEGLEACR